MAAELGTIEIIDSLFGVNTTPVIARLLRNQNLFESVAAQALTNIATFSEPEFLKLQKALYLITSERSEYLLALLELIQSELKLTDNLNELKESRLKELILGVHLTKPDSGVSWKDELNTKTTILDCFLLSVSREVGELLHSGRLFDFEDPLEGYLSLSSYGHQFVLVREFAGSSELNARKVLELIPSYLFLTEGKTGFAGAMLTIELLINGEAVGEALLDVLFEHAITFPSEEGSVVGWTIGIATKKLKEFVQSHEGSAWIDTHGSLKFAGNSPSPLQKRLVLIEEALKRKVSQLTEDFNQPEENLFSATALVYLCDNNANAEQQFRSWVTHQSHREIVATTITLRNLCMVDPHCADLLLRLNIPLCLWEAYGRGNSAEGREEIIRLFIDVVSLSDEYQEEGMRDFIEILRDASEADQDFLYDAIKSLGGSQLKKSEAAFTKFSTFVLDTWKAMLHADHFADSTILKFGNAVRELFKFHQPRRTNPFRKALASLGNELAELTPNLVADADDILRQNFEEVLRVLAQLRSYPRNERPPQSLGILVGADYTPIEGISSHHQYLLANSTKAESAMVAKVILDALTSNPNAVLSVDPQCADSVYSALYKRGKRLGLLGLFEDLGLAPVSAFLDLEGRYIFSSSSDAEHRFGSRINIKPVYLLYPDSYAPSLYDPLRHYPGENPQHIVVLKADKFGGFPGFQLNHPPQKPSVILPASLDEAPLELGESLLFRFTLGWDVIGRAEVVIIMLDPETPPLIVKRIYEGESHIPAYIEAGEPLLGYDCPAATLKYTPAGVSWIIPRSIRPTVLESVKED